MRDYTASAQSFFNNIDPFRTFGPAHQIKTPPRTLK
jgi:hypothetical protein